MVAPWRSLNLLVVHRRSADKDQVANGLLILGKANAANETGVKVERTVHFEPMGEASAVARVFLMGDWQAEESLSTRRALTNRYE